MDKYSKAHYWKNLERHRIQARVWARTARAKRWQQVLDKLGRACVCCGENEPLFLTVDHINNDGHKETQKSRGGRWRGRAGGDVYKAVLRDPNASARFQILCYNCNCGRNRTADKVCPHLSHVRELAA